jgi:CheY-like chemotaxis protein
MDYSNKKLLIIDDDEAFAKFVKKYSQIELGVNADTATNPKAGFELLNKNKYDLIMLDMEMPVMDGYSALREIRLMKNLKNIPVIICTAIVSPTLIASLAKLGIESYIAKPSKSNIIINKIKTALDKNITRAS